MTEKDKMDTISNLFSDLANKDEFDWSEKGIINVNDLTSANKSF